LFATYVETVAAAGTVQEAVSKVDAALQVQVAPIEVS
jgi:hypothetical protein